MNDDILQKLFNYLNDLPEPSLAHTKDEFKFYSYARTMILEIIEQILDCPFEAVDDILWKLILDLIHYEKEALTEDTKKLFGTMREVAVDVHYLLINEVKPYKPGEVVLINGEPCKCTCTFSLSEDAEYQDVYISKGEQYG